MRVVLTERLCKSLVAAPPEIQKLFGKQLAALLRDIRHSSLQAKKHPEAGPDIWQARINDGWRLFPHPERHLHSARPDAAPKIARVPAAVVPPLPANWTIARESSNISGMRLLHTMIRVTDLDESLRFYCDQLGMKLLRKHDFPPGRFTLAFVGYETEDRTAVIELTYNWDTHQYEIGNGFGHIALGVSDIYKTCAELRAKGVKVVREPGPMQHGSTVIAFIEDPNGYRIELIEVGR